jgi:acyl-CoA synthetase (AMP-forming)/AMP-acid ligase II
MFPMFPCRSCWSRRSKNIRKNRPDFLWERRSSYGELLEQITAAPPALAAMGVKKGDTVAIYLLNSPQFMISYFGALKAGAKVTPISPVYTSQEVGTSCKDSDARIVVCEDMLYANIERRRQTGQHHLSNLGDYLPLLKRAFAKKMISKAYEDLKPPTPERSRRWGCTFSRISSKNIRPSRRPSRSIRKPISPLCRTPAAPPDCPKPPC